MLLLIDLTSYTTNMKNKILKKRLYIIVDIKCKDINPEKPDVPLNKNDAFQKVQKRRVQEKR